MPWRNVKAERETRIHHALVRLAAARREKLAPEDYDVFADGLSQFDPTVVQQVCDELGRMAPDEWQPRFPPLFVIRTQCFRVQAHREAERTLRLNPPAKEPPLPPEKWEAIKAQFQAVLQRKVMR